tara:strand:- start:720 stop:1034 length:315 start_codon:yes stop_codon:yes gene_type:complete
MADSNGRPDHIEEYLSTLHNESWFYFTDPNNKTYSNLALTEKILNPSTGRLINNPHSLPSESDCNTGLANLQTEWDNVQSNKTSGKTKLKDLGLTDEEISALLE